MNESHIIQLNNLNAEYRILKAEHEHLAQLRKRLIKWIFMSPLLGIALGAFVMVYFEKPTLQPVTVSAPTAVSIDRLADIERRMALLEAQKEANTIRAEQRVMDMRTALDKLERMKVKHDGQLMRVEQGHERSSGDYPASNPTTHDDAPLSLQQMAKELGVTSAVLK